MQSLGRKKWLKSNFLHVWSHPFLMMWPSLKTSLTNTFGEEVHGPWGLLCVSWTWGPNPPPSPSYGLYPLPLCAQSPAGRPNPPWEGEWAYDISQSTYLNGLLKGGFFFFLMAEQRKCTCCYFLLHIRIRLWYKLMKGIGAQVRRNQSTEKEI